MPIKWNKDKKELIKAYLKGDMTVAEVAKAMKLSYKQVEHAITRYDLRKGLPTQTAKKVENKLSLDKLDKNDIEKKIRATEKTWAIPKGLKNNKERENYKVYLYTADHHVPEYNIPANKAIHRLMDDIKFDGFRIAGDYMDMAPISHWNEHKRRTLETQRLKEDYAVGNVLLDEYDKRLPANCDKAFFWGNHEDWYNQLIEKLPVLEGMLNPTEELNLIKRGYKSYEDLNHIEKIGRLSVCHGIYANIHAVKKHIDVFKTNVMFFHTHRIGSRSDCSPAKEIAIIGYNVGCLCDKNPDYLRNKPNAWSHGFAIVYYMSNGFFFVNNVRIIKGRFIYNNKIYDGNV